MPQRLLARAWTKPFRSRPDATAYTSSWKLMAVDIQIASRQKRGQDLYRQKKYFEALECFNEVCSHYSKHTRTTRGLLPSDAAKDHKWIFGSLHQRAGQPRCHTREAWWPSKRPQGWEADDNPGQDPGHGALRPLPQHRTLLLTQKIERATSGLVRYCRRWERMRLHWASTSTVFVTFQPFARISRQVFRSWS